MPGVGFERWAGAEIKVCFLPSHVAWSFGLDDLNSTSLEFKPGIVGGFQGGVNPNTTEAAGGELGPGTPLFRGPALRGPSREATCLLGF